MWYDLIKATSKRSEKSIELDRMGQSEAGTRPETTCYRVAYTNLFCLSGR